MSHAVIWDYENNIETELPDMPKGVARVYPASGAVSMLPLTPANNYQQTILFCGGSDMPDQAWGNYSFPFINTWDYPASRDCQRITPEPSDGSPPVYVQDDDLLDSRTMGQFILLPDGKVLIVNGGLNGTAGYASATGETPSYDQMPYGQSLSAGPVFTPAIYDPNAPAGSRWSDRGLSASKIPRLYHSSAILLPDASVLIAGSNPNVDVNLTTTFPTTYQAEIFYPPYFSAQNRPVPKGVPSTLSYGGQPFDIKIPSSSYSGPANDAADKTVVAITRGGFTTHAMNMGQRYMQLKNTYTVNRDGSITLHVAQPPPNANLFQPGPALLWVVINGIPSNGTMLIVGNGQISNQPLLPESELPPSVRLDSVSGTGSNNEHNSGGASTTSRTPLIIGGIIGAIVLIGLAVAGGVWIRKRKAAAAAPSTVAGPSYASGSLARAPKSVYPDVRETRRSSNASAFVPLGQDQGTTWNSSTARLATQSPYSNTAYVEDADPRPSGTASSSRSNLDPYTAAPRSEYGAGRY